ncbi:hypothetical protein GN956_G14192 [Arapaima gigas]
MQQLIISVLKICILPLNKKVATPNQTWLLCLDSSATEDTPAEIKIHLTVTRQPGLQILGRSPNSTAFGWSVGWISPGLADHLPPAFTELQRQVFGRTGCRQSSSVADDVNRR